MTVAAPVPAGARTPVVAENSRRRRSSIPLSILGPLLALFGLVLLRCCSCNFTFRSSVDRPISAPGGMRVRRFELFRRCYRSALRLGVVRSLGVRDGSTVGASWSDSRLPI